MLDRGVRDAVDRFHAAVTKSVFVDSVCDIDEVVSLGRNTYTAASDAIGRRLRELYGEA